MRDRHIRLRRVALVLGVVLAAGVWTTSQTAIASPQSSDPADQALARRAALKVSDLPAGWREKRHDTAADKKGDDVRNGIRECRSYQELRKLTKRSPQVNRDFAKASSTGINSTVAVLRTEQDARHVLAGVTDRDLGTCLEKSLKKFLANEGTVTGVEVGALSVKPAGDEVTGYEAVVSLSTKGLTPDLYFDLEFVRVGRAVAYFLFADVLSPLTDGRDSTINVVVDRLGAARSTTTTVTTA